MTGGWKYVSCRSSSVVPPTRWRSSARSHIVHDVTQRLVTFGSKVRVQAPSTTHVYMHNQGCHFNKDVGKTGRN